MLAETLESSLLSVSAATPPDERPVLLVAFWIEGGCEGGRCAQMAALGNALEIDVPSWQDEGWSGQGTTV